MIDTGVDINQPDLTNRLWVNPGETAGNGVDDDLNGFVDDVNGWDFQGNDKNPTPANSLDDSHGTHVAGIVAAENDNNEGISGVCPDCTIMALRIGTAASLTLGNELKAINYAINNHADVINLSLGDPVWSKAERAAIARAGKAGILVVVAAGNSSMDNDIQFYEQPQGQPPSWAPSYPASYTLKNILAVAASNDRDQYGYVSQCQSQHIPLWQCGFTSWGHDSVDVAAPGVDILSTVQSRSVIGAYLSELRVLRWHVDGRADGRRDRRARPIGASGVFGRADQERDHAFRQPPRLTEALRRVGTGGGRRQGAAHRVTSRGRKGG